jgi:hypothetical protein
MKNKKSFLTVDVNVKDIDVFKKLLGLLKKIGNDFPETEDFIIKELEKIIKE